MKACKTSGEGWGWAGSRCSKGEPGHRSHIVGSPRGGEGGLVPKGTAIERRHRRHQYEEPEVDRRLTFYPFRTKSYVGDVGKLRQGRQPMNGTIWGKNGPQLEQRRWCRPPPLVVVGGITFYLNAKRSGS